MSSTLHSGELKTTSAEELRHFREVLAAANYTGACHTEFLTPFELVAPRNVPHLVRISAPKSQLKTLVLMFLFGVPTDAAAARDAVQPVQLESLEQMGLLKLEAGVATAKVSLVPFGNLVLAVDLHEKIYNGAPSDVVMGMTQSTLELGNITIRKPSRKTLDFGTGSGIQAFLAAAHSDRVYAVDCSSRALNFARFSAALNGISNIEFIEGNGFDAVRGLRFDLIVANPPFAVTPERRYVYRDSGMHLDAFAESLIRRAPEFLEESGFFQCQCDWVHIAGGNWQERLSHWVHGSGCNAWIIRQQTLAPPVYAEAWIRSTEQDDHATAFRLCEEWSDFYRRENVEAISTGFICLRRAAGRSNWLRIDDPVGEISDGSGASIELGFALRDFLETVRNDEALLQAKLRTSPDVRLAREAAWSVNGWQGVKSKIGLSRGLSYTASIDPPVATLIAHCDAQHTLAELMTQMGSSLGVAIERLIPATMPLVRQLIERGFLLPASMIANSPNQQHRLDHWSF